MLSGIGGERGNVHLTHNETLLTGTPRTPLECDELDEADIPRIL